MMPSDGTGLQFRTAVRKTDRRAKSWATLLSDNDVVE
jgi:hypothetical protein